MSNFEWQGSPTTAAQIYEGEVKLMQATGAQVDEVNSFYDIDLVVVQSLRFPDGTLLEAKIEHANRDGFNGWRYHRNYSPTKKGSTHNG